MFQVAHTCIWPKISFTCRCYLFIQRDTLKEIWICPVSQFAGIVQYTGLGLLDVCVVPFMLPRIACSCPNSGLEVVVPMQMTWHIYLHGIEVGYKVWLCVGNPHCMESLDYINGYMICLIPL